MSFISSSTVITTFLVFMIILSAVNSQEYEGDSCTITRTGFLGICKPLSKCKPAQDDLKIRRIQPQRCGWSSTESLVCCSSGTPPPTTQSTVTTVNRDQVECAFPKYAITVRRDEYSLKSWNKCIDLAENVFPCIALGLNLNANKNRMDTCEHTATELILGGTEAKPNEFPHMAVLGFENAERQTYEWDCGGTLISEQWVMSAAHCLYHRSLRVEISRIRLGGGDLRIPADIKYIFSVIRKVTHPDYSGLRTYNDILLLQMDRTVKYSKMVRPACLHVGIPVKERKAIAIGYGTIEDRETKSNLLLKVVLDKFSFEECSEKNPGTRKSPDGVRNETQICYGSHTEIKDTCQGDSGGPLQIYNQGVHCTYIVIGITSVGKQCGLVGSPGLYTRVSAFVPWIESVVWPN